MTTTTVSNASSILTVRDDFSFTPGPRYTGEGEFSGQEFRNAHLKPAVESAISNGYKLIVILDGTAGYGTSFLEEAFGGLIREDDISYDLIINSIEFITTEEPYLEEDVRQYLLDAKSAAQK